MVLGAQIYILSWQTLSQWPLMLCWPSSLCAGADQMILFSLWYTLGLRDCLWCSLTPSSIVFGCSKEWNYGVCSPEEVTFCFRISSHINLYSKAIFHSTDEKEVRLSQSAGGRKEVGHTLPIFATVSHYQSPNIFCLFLPPLQAFFFSFPMLLPLPGNPWNCYLFSSVKHANSFERPCLVTILSNFMLTQNFVYNTFTLSFWDLDICTHGYLYTQMVRSLLGFISSATFSRVPFT